MTKGYEQFTLAHFRGDKAQTAKLLTFGWHQGDSHVRTLCEHNLPARARPEDDGNDSAAWLAAWAKAFDVEAVTLRFFRDYAEVFTAVEAAVKGVPKGEDRRLYTQRLFNRLMFLYFIQRKGWLKFRGDRNYLRGPVQRGAGGRRGLPQRPAVLDFFWGLNTLNEQKGLHSDAE